MSNIRVFLCDDHTLFRQGIRKLLELEGDITVVGEANNGLEMLEMLKKAGPDIVLMDIGMPKMDGVTATYKIKKLLPSAGIIILTVYEDEPHIFAAIKAGAMGYLLKDVSFDDLIEAIRSVSKGEALIQPVIATKVLKEFALLDKRKIKEGDKFYSGLTEREEEILRLIALGGTNKEIAKKLGITEKTVKNHISSIFQTLHVNNRTQAAIYALDKKI
ncbi:MAG: DNA-binding response regulator [Candidatus Omnitrophica bacterium CG23_combo_of_CG06-09_8_20_14_all_40_11]|nr:MAG: DNA-binding response regulator [Candidatus Omnitrophica bacterium CG23_combo_of_CG06-09_8_20_14_all_40_11]